MDICWGVEVGDQGDHTYLRPVAMSNHQLTLLLTEVAIFKKMYKYNAHNMLKKK